MSEPEFDMNAVLRSVYRGQGSDSCKNLYDLDQLISEVFPKKYQRKMARLIADVCEASLKQFSADEVAQRLTELVDKGVYAGYGNLAKWGYSEIGPIKSEAK